jgi:cytochrome c oxidase cbb3-type subunit 3
MTSGWSLFIVLVTLFNIFGCLWLLRWTSRPRTAGEKIGGGADTGHVWDKDLREYNNPLPRWWLWLFYITIVFSLVYLVLYPGLGTFKGIKGAQCHGSDGGGAKGFPNLTDRNWQWGGDPDTIVQTIMAGRMAVMPPWGQVLGASGVDQVVAYVEQLSGQQADASLAAAGKTIFETNCAACHGMDGKGNPLLGAPDLTDGTWLYGGDPATLRLTVANGRNGQMPAFGERLGPERVRLLAAYATHLAGTGT